MWWTTRYLRAKFSRAIVNAVCWATLKLKIRETFRFTIVRESTAGLFNFLLQRTCKLLSWSGIFKARNPLVCWGWCLILTGLSAIPLMGHLGCLASHWVSLWEYPYHDHDNNFSWTYTRLSPQWSLINWFFPILTMISKLLKTSLLFEIYLAGLSVIDLELRSFLYWN